MSEGILCTASLIFFFRFYFIILLQNSMLVHTLLFSDFFAIKLLCDKGEKVYFDVQYSKLHTSFVIPPCLHRDLLR